MLFPHVHLCKQRRFYRVFYMTHPNLSSLLPLDNTRRLFLDAWVDTSVVYIVVDAGHRFSVSVR